MKRSVVVLLLLGFLAGASQGQGIFGNDWMGGLFDSINKLNANIQGSVQRINQDIQEGVRTHLARVDSLNKELAMQIGNSSGSSVVLGNGGSTILVNGVGGVTRTVFSGTSPNGEPYFRDSEDRTIGGILHHTDRVYNPKTRGMDVYRYTLNLTDPNAKPVPVPVESPN